MSNPEPVHTTEAEPVELPDMPDHDEGLDSPEVENAPEVPA